MYSKERKKRRLRLWDPPGRDSASRRERKDTGAATSAPHHVNGRDTATHLARPTTRQRDNATTRPSSAQPAPTCIDWTRSAHAQHAPIGHWSGVRPGPPASNARTRITMPAGQRPHHTRGIDNPPVYSRLGARGSGLGAGISGDSRNSRFARSRRQNARARSGGDTQQRRTSESLCSRARRTRTREWVDRRSKMWLMGRSTAVLHACRAHGPIRRSILVDNRARRGFATRVRQLLGLEEAVGRDAGRQEPTRRKIAG